MHTENSICIVAPDTVVFELAANIERWPDLLSHYRYVRKVAEMGESRFASGPVFAMQAMRTGFPCSWTSIQEIDRTRGKILYHHVAGVTMGMNVVWTIERDHGRTRAVIDHDLDPRWWWLKPRPISWIVGTQFVMHIAQRTLTGISDHVQRTRRQISVTP